MKTIARYQTILFFFLTVVFTWSVWIPAAIEKSNGIDSPLAPSSPLGSLARWTPGLVAVLLTAIIGGIPGIKALFRSIRIGRVNILWYAFALFFEAGLFFAARGLDTLLGNSYQVTAPLVREFGTQGTIIIPVMILFAMPGALAEELGWRGFALPRLQVRRGALVSSLVIGLVWGIWHIPMWVYYELGSLEIALAVTGTIPIAILYTWLYNNTKGSLLLVFLFHFGQQLSLSLLGSWPGYVDEIMVWTISILLVLLPGAANFIRIQSIVKQQKEA